VLALAMTQARESLTDARHAISDLRQNERAGAMNLAQALKDEIQRFISATGISCDLEISMPNEITDLQCETAYRMVAECLTNTARHAEANRAWVRTEQGEGLFTIEVGDDGKGFIPDAVIDIDGHYGLMGLRERARLVGGSLHIQSQPGLGTVMRMEFPVAAGTT
jgi:NarL family two-component system sensor histidine kinase YdfH